MTDEIMDLKDRIRKFWLRDFERDVSDLNRELRKPRKDRAGFESVPPSVLTGDLFNLKPGECLLILGMNPKWRAGGMEAEWAKRDIIPAINLHKEGDFKAYSAARAEYFTVNNGAYHGRHFTRLGNLLAPHFFGGQADSAIDFMNRHAAVMDLLPWWSTNIENIDPNKLCVPLEPLMEWRGVIEAAIETLRPSLIIVHGLGFRQYAEAMLDTELHEFEWGKTNTGNRVRGYFGERSYGQRVLAHALVTEDRVLPPKGWAYSDLLDAWVKSIESRCCAKK